MTADRVRSSVPLWAVVLSSAALVLVAAKAHGRQVRLEREQKGVFHVDFRRRSGNPAAVEAIWRRDRLTLWPTFGVFVVLGAAATLAREAPPWHLAFAVAWSLAAAFVVAGLASWVRMARRKEGPLPWRRRARLGSAGWWAGVAAAAALVALSL